MAWTERPGTPRLAFRPATPDDAASVAALANAAYRLPPGPRGWTSEAELIAGQRTDATMLVDQLATPGVTILVATLPASAATPDVELVACVQLSPSGDPGVGEIGLFAVHPDHQGTGVGGATLTQAEDLARRSGYQRVRLLVIESRSELVGWYHRRGYAPTGAVQAFPYGDERFGTPRRQGLRFRVLERHLTTGETNDASEPGGQAGDTGGTGRGCR